MEFWEFDDDPTVWGFDDVDDLEAAREMWPPPPQARIAEATGGDRWPTAGGEFWELDDDPTAVDVGAVDDPDAARHEFFRQRHQLMKQYSADQPMRLQSIKLDKIGPRGGPGGGVRDVRVPPYRLLRLAIHSKGAIHGISFSYSDGSVHHESWGGVSGFEEHPIQLGLTDYVKEISGTTGAYTFHYPNIVRSLKVVTFKRTYGPYGATDGAGRPFSFPVQGSARITGFFGRSGDYLDSIGVYIREC